MVWSASDGWVGFFGLGLDSAIYIYIYIYACYSFLSFFCSLTGVFKER